MCSTMAIPDIWKEIIEIYRVSKPRKLKDVGALLDEWEGDEDELLENIRAKYRCVRVQAGSPILRIVDLDSRS